MTRDGELDRLKTAQESAFQHKQAAYQAMQTAWERRTKAREAMNRAFDAKQRAYAEQDATWQDYLSVKNRNGPRIDQLNAQQETAYQNMVRSFENASAAHDRHDGASARSCADEGHRYKAESQGYVTQRRALVADIRAARERHEATKPAFQHAKAEFNTTKATFDQAKSEHERKQAEFKRAKVDSDKATKAFKDRLATVRAERREQRRRLAEKADVPYEYRDNVWVSTDADGNTNIYFGGVGKPDGPGHGHYVLNRSGEVTYKRAPFDPHGAQNFTSNQTDYFDAIRTEAVSGSDEFGFRCTYKGLPALVETGYDTRTGRQKINIYYGAVDGMVGSKHGHAIAYRDEPHVIIEDRSPR